MALEGTELVAASALTNMERSLVARPTTGVLVDGRAFEVVDGDGDLYTVVVMRGEAALNVAALEAAEAVTVTKVEAAALREPEPGTEAWRAMRGGADYVPPADPAWEFAKNRRSHFDE